MSTANTGAANATFSVEIFTRTGTALGGPVGSGPGSSTAGWTSLGTVPAVQGSTASGISLIFNIPPIMVQAHDTVGVAIQFATVGPRYYGSGSPPIETYSDTNLTLRTGDGRSVPFTPTGSWFSSRALCGVIRYIVETPPTNGWVSQTSGVTTSLNTVSAVNQNVGWIGGNGGVVLRTINGGNTLDKRNRRPNRYSRCILHLRIKRKHMPCIHFTRSNVCIQNNRWRNNLDTGIYPDGRIYR